MSPRDDQRREPVLEVYRRLEPDGADTWNPLVREKELVHRLALYEQICRALRCSPVAPADLRVLDVGCGNGRSTRVYLDFGLLPGQLEGVDLRPAAIELARQSHEGIRFSVQDGQRLPQRDASVTWVSVCTVMSSVGGGDAREHLAGEIRRVLGPGGVVFYWDLERAHGFAGGDVLDPAAIFHGWRALYAEHVCAYGRVERVLPNPALRRLLAPLLRRLGARPTHRAALLARP